MEVYSLVAELGNKVGKALRLAVDYAQLAEGERFRVEDISVLQDDGAVKQSARRGAWIAYQELGKQGFLSSVSLIPRSGVVFDFSGTHVKEVKGPSAGLCFVIKMAQEIFDDALTLAGRDNEIPCRNCAATGIIEDLASLDDEVGRVESLPAKIRAAIAIVGREGLIFYPQANADDPELASTLHELEGQVQREEITLFAVQTPRQALDRLLEVYPEQLDTFEDRISLPRTPRWRVYVTLVPALIVLMGMGVWLSPRMLNTHPTVPSIVEGSLFREPRQGETNEPHPLRDGDVLKQGEGFGIRVTVDRDCYLYVLNVDTSNQLSWLFPLGQQAKIVPTGTHWVPEDPAREQNWWAELDDVMGEEAVLLWASPHASEWLERNKNRIDESKRLSASERYALRTELAEYFEREQRARRGTLHRLFFQHR